MTGSGTGGPHGGWRVLCLGLGYTAAALARRICANGGEVAGTARTIEGAAQITRAGWQGLIFDGGHVTGTLEATVAEATHVLVSAPPDEAGDPILRSLGGVLARARRLGWIGYLSTVGVYGDHAGGWVDEATTPRDPGVRGERRLAAEQAWLAFGAAHAIRTEVFRLPGIYGPGRSVIDQLRAGTARRIKKEGQVFNRVHVDDIAMALATAMAAGSHHVVYNIVDDEPAPADEVVAFGANLLGMAPPPLVRFEDAELSPMARSFYAQSKRVSNRRLKESLGVKLAYPTYRAGLRAIVGADAAAPEA